MKDRKMQKNLMSFNFPRYLLPPNFLNILKNNGMKKNWKAYKWCEQIMNYQRKNHFITVKQKDRVRKTLKTNIMKQNKRDQPQKSPHPSAAPSEKSGVWQR